MFDFLKDIITLNVNDYLTGGPDLKINLFMLAITLGICVGTVIMGVYKCATIALLKQLIRHGATGEENAKTLKELRLFDKRLLRFYLSRKGQLTLIVGRVGEKTYTYEEMVALQKQKGYKEERIDFSTAAFFIRNEKADRANHIYENESASPIRIALYCILFVALYFCLAMLMPAILNLIEGILN